MGASRYPMWFPYHLHMDIIQVSRETEPQKPAVSNIKSLVLLGNFDKKGIGKPVYTFFF